MIQGFMIVNFIQLCALIPTFWTGSPRGFMDLFHALTPVWERPVEIFPSIVKRILTTTIPIGLIADFPCKVLFNEANTTQVISSIVVTIIFGFVTLQFWKLGMRNYTSSSS